MTPARYPRARARRRLHWAIAAVVLVAVVAIVLAVSLGGSGLSGAPPAGDAPETGPEGLFHYDSAHAAEYIARATTGNGQVLFSKSPGGAIATARRVAALRPMIDRAVAGSNIPASALEGLVFLESAGLPDAVVAGDPGNAAGLTQILPSTATSLLHMHVDLTASRRLLAQISQARTPAQQRSLQRRLEAADQRFDPAAALSGAVRLLTESEGMFGDHLDLAVTAYHMGPGNMQHVLADYDGGKPVPYVQLYFDTAPDHNASAYKLLSTLGDDSSLYWWRVLGAEQIMHLYRTDRGALRRLQSLETADAAGGSVLHPPGRSPRYADPRSLQSAYTSHALQRLPRNATAARPRLRRLDRVRRRAGGRPAVAVPGPEPGGGQAPDPDGRGRADVVGRSHAAARRGGRRRRQVPVGAGRRGPDGADGLRVPDRAALSLGRPGGGVPGRCSTVCSR